MAKGDGMVQKLAAKALEAAVMKAVEQFDVTKGFRVKIDMTFEPLEKDGNTNT